MSVASTSESSVVIEWPVVLVIRRVMILMEEPHPHPRTYGDSGDARDDEKQGHRRALYFLKRSLWMPEPSMEIA
jgi:hypothetical protein